jgi:hypothetical protein
MYTIIIGRMASSGVLKEYNFFYISAHLELYRRSLAQPRMIYICSAIHTTNMSNIYYCLYKL